MGRILIAEDDVLISQLLERILKELGHTVMGIVTGLSEATAFIKESELPDLAMLDIRMHNKDQGVEIAKLMNQKGVPFVFVTSFSDKKTVQVAVAEKPWGYIVKPFSPEEIKEVVAAVFQQIKPKYLLIKERKKQMKIMFNDIYYLESENIYVKIYTKTDVVQYRSKLNEILAILPESEFVRIHQSFIINKKQVAKIGSTYVIVQNREIPVSAKYHNVLNQIY